jgi:hypothetical protein
MNLSSLFLFLTFRPCSHYLYGGYGFVASSAPALPAVVRVECPEAEDALPSFDRG